MVEALPGLRLRLSRLVNPLHLLVIDPDRHILSDIICVLGCKDGEIDS